MKMFKTSMKVSYVVILLLCISCNKEEKKITQEITQLEKESKKLEKEIEYYKNKTKEAKTKSYSLYNYNYEHYVDEKEVINALPNKLKYLTNKKEVFKTIFNDLSLQNTSIYGSMVSYKDFNVRYNSLNKSSFIRSQLSFFDRSSKSIEKFFNDKTINIITSFFKGNSYYKDSGAQYFIEGLLVTHSAFESKNDEDLETIFNEYYNWSLRSDKYNDEGKVNNQVRDLQKKLFYDYVIKYFRTAKFSNYEDTKYHRDSEGNLTDYKIEEFVERSYSFWARRYHEGNHKIVSEKLYEIHYKITGNELLWGEE